MKIHRHLLEQSLLALQEIFEQGHHADKVIERSFKANKRWGARDRRFFAETVYEIVRWRRLVESLFFHFKGKGSSSSSFSPDRNLEDLLGMWAIWRVYRGQEVPRELGIFEKGQEPPSAELVAMQII